MNFELLESQNAAVSTTQLINEEWWITPFGLRPRLNGPDHLGPLHKLNTKLINRGTLILIPDNTNSSFEFVGFDVPPNEDKHIFQILVDIPNRIVGWRSDYPSFVSSGEKKIGDLRTAAVLGNRLERAREYGEIDYLLTTMSETLKTMGLPSLEPVTETMDRRY